VAHIGSAVPDGGNASGERLIVFGSETEAGATHIRCDDLNLLLRAADPACAEVPAQSVKETLAASVAHGADDLLRACLEKCLQNVDTEEADPQVIAQTMLDAASTVTTAQITYAARNSDFDGFAINEGDYLALVNGKLFGTDRDINVLLEKLADLASDQGAEFVTAFYGEGVSEDDANAATEIFSARCGDAEVSALPGGQPVYYYIISIE
jgi:dihydroxyacetone kinase-like predicted kinase